MKWLRGADSAPLNTNRVNKTYLQIGSTFLQSYIEFVYSLVECTGLTRFIRCMSGVASLTFKCFENFFNWLRKLLIRICVFWEKLQYQFVSLATTMQPYFRTINHIDLQRFWRVVYSDLKSGVNFWQISLSRQKIVLWVRLIFIWFPQNNCFLWKMKVWDTFIT